ncbi:hypothetical protein CN210_34480 [Sinorhizobium meliloti]|uniref:hypothetical protein n=1 Tax=Rhizobium meliloti TaxID=382 RepID=UPI000FD80C1F|nr:hypothetical protein [Sinorhizobium meliloti]MDE3775520.1 hypothetical protein [Sinorhizobium meliloti]RVG91308.1 hypothetical protein CN210_34480 [Sinorhizobium meliloti]RVK68682.1 hypothetical protein CN154_27330 [Sinorhizobium meliloti]
MTATIATVKRQILNDNRQQYVIQRNDPKGEEGFGKFLGVVMVFLMFLGVVQLAFDSAIAWYRDIII